MKVLIDTNILLDFLLQREPFFADADLLFQAIASGQIVGYATATTITDIFYIARKHTWSLDQARQVVSETLTFTVICPVNLEILESAITSGLADFEDAVQIACAVAQKLEVIVTRDKQGFSSSPIPVFSIRDLLQQLQQM